MINRIKEELKMMIQVKKIIKQTLEESGIKIFIPNPLGRGYESIMVEDSHYFEIQLSETKLTFEKQTLFFNILQEELSKKVNVWIEDNSMSIFRDLRTDYLTIGLNLPAGSF